MSALLQDIPRLRVMRVSDLDAIMEIEPEIYAYPWTRGNFSDSLATGYSCWVMECGGFLVGYGVLMQGVEEAHLLNISIAKSWQGQGLGRKLLQHFIGVARAGKSDFLYLEVRPSNVVALGLYLSAGFQRIAIRRNYYPAFHGREDAILLGLRL
ncbi:MAG: ribosomal protein S18-alanine N-acetyltransferase [Pseudomonadota bacterium]